MFGCVAFAHISDSDRKKLDKKARKYGFMGYGLRSKGYRLLDVEEKTLVIRRDVKFNEAVFDMSRFQGKLL